MTRALPPRPSCGSFGGVKTDGRPCAAPALTGGQRCRYHTLEALGSLGGAANGPRPNVAAEMLDRTAANALRHGVPTAPQTLDDAVAWSSWAMHALAAGALDHKTAHVIAVLVTAFRGALEKRDLLRQIEKLRAELAAARSELPASAPLALRRGSRG